MAGHSVILLCSVKGIGMIGSEISQVAVPMTRGSRQIYYNLYQVQNELARPDPQKVMEMAHRTLYSYRKDR